MRIEFLPETTLYILKTPVHNIAGIVEFFKLVSGQGQLNGAVDTIPSYNTGVADEHITPAVLAPESARYRQYTLLVREYSPDNSAD